MLRPWPWSLRSPCVAGVTCEHWLVIDSGGNWEISSQFDTDGWWNTGEICSINFLQSLCDF